ncbi:MAG: MFS transporter [Candidatus Latescibacteria bacterium]|nr:MFS transporter [Candidatus Latescibacterota bacterium]
MAKHDPYEAFRVKAFRLYALGWFASLVGTQIQGAAIGWEMYARTGQALALGLVGLAIALPTMILALPAGYLADRYNRRTVMMLSMAGTTLTSLGLAVLSWKKGPIGVMYALLVVDAAVTVLGSPARRSIIPQLVPREIFPNAVVWTMSMMQTAWMVGPALGGLIAAYYVPAAYLVSAGCTGWFLLVLSQLHVPPVEREEGAEQVSAFRNLMGGLVFLKENRLLLSVMALDMFAVLLGGAVYLLPIYATDILNVGSEGYGILRAAPAVGALVMALTIAHLPPMKRAGRNLLLTVAGFGVATIVFGLSENFWLSFVMLVLTGAFDNVSMVIRHTLVQLITPDSMRGRVSAVNGVFVSASNELGGAESGGVAALYGPVFSVVSGGIGTLVVVGVTAVISPKLRKVGTLDELEEGKG